MNCNTGESNADANGEKEIASRTMQIQSKRFYLDVKQNRRGRFLKIAEVGAGGQKSRIMMSMSSTVEFRDKLQQLVKHLASMPTDAAIATSAKGDSGNTGGGGGSGGLKFRSETLFKDNRRYFLDLKENQRGRYLRIVQQLAPSGMRSQIALPAEGISELSKQLTELIDECGTEDAAEGVEQLPEARTLRIGNKTFYFDVGFNRRGTFLRVSEVRPNFRTAVTVPEKSWPALRDILTEYIEKSASGDIAATAASADEDGESAAASGDSEDEEAGGDAAGKN